MVRQVGRRNTYLAFGALGIPTLLAMPTFNAMAASGQSGVLPLYGFVASSSLLVSCCARAATATRGRTAAVLTSPLPFSPSLPASYVWGHRYE